MTPNYSLSIKNYSIICVTGKMAAGKNYICSQFEKEGWLCLDADKQVHKAIQMATPLILTSFEKEAEEKGICLTNPDGTLNRRALGALIFSDPELLRRQENLVYPYLIEETKQFIAEHPGQKIILNATVLYKVPELLDLCQKIIFVTAPFLTRLRRARKRDHLPYKQILSRFWAQRNLLKEYKKSGISLEILRNN